LILLNLTLYHAFQTFLCVNFIRISKKKPKRSCRLVRFGTFVCSRRQPCCATECPVWFYVK